MQFGLVQPVEYGMAQLSEAPADEAIAKQPVPTERAEGVVAAERDQRAEIAHGEGRNRLAFEPARNVPAQMHRLLACDFLVREGFDVGRLHVATLMKRMRIAAIYRRPNTSKPAPGHKIYPYLLRKLAITRPNQVWAIDITYIPMARGFVYLAAVVDWFSRKVLAWRLSITMDTAFCIEVVEEALAKHGRPEIFNSDQGRQFTSVAFTDLLKKHEIAISMDGKGAWRDNVFVERLWRTIKYEEVYLRAYASVPEARASLGRYIDHFYNARTMPADLIRALTGRRRTRPTSMHCHQSRWQPNRGRNPLSDSPETVQTNRTTSLEERQT